MTTTIVHLYNNENFPCFVKNGADIEDPQTASNEKEKYARIARNALRHLTYGTSLRESKLLTWDNFSALFIKRDAKLFDALRKEMQNVFSNVYLCLNQQQLDPLAEKRVEIFINNLLCAYPFMDPKRNEKVILPQKINNSWQQIKYHFKKIDISPQSGLLSKLIEDEDRLYAYGLVSTHRFASPYLLLEGSTYPSRQGAALNWLYNFKPNTSVGEGHDTNILSRWIERHRNITVAGHSKGGTMAMIIASKFPYWISQANCLNPTGLSRATINRLKSTWKQVPNIIKPQINIYTQAGDPVFLIENSFLTNIFFYRIGKITDGYGAVESHAHYLTGRKTASIAEILDFEREIFSKKRQFISDLKEALNWALFPILYMKLCCKLSLRKVERFCNQHAALIKSTLFLSAIGLSGLLIASGLGAPLILAVAAKIGVPLAVTTVCASTITACTVSSIALPKLAKVTANVASSALFYSAAMLAVCTTLTIGMVLSSLKIGLRSLLPTSKKTCPILHPPAKPIISVKKLTSSPMNILRRIKSEPNLNFLKQDKVTLPEKKPSLLKRKWTSELNLTKLSLISSKCKEPNKLDHPHLNPILKKNSIY